MNNLINELERFDKEIDDVISDSELNAVFGKLAPAFLYGGYIQVRNDYKIYIRTVEFYFHSEKENGVHDPIVYHRNRRDYDGKVLMEIPYFPIMTLYAHVSGFDITFESSKKEYRASALIRAYEVKNKKGEYLKWDQHGNGQYMFIEHPNYKYNTQSTYLYDLLNGFTLGEENDIKWVDSPRESSLLTGKLRKNVFLSESDFVYKRIKGKRCERLWSFTRGEQV